MRICVNCNTPLRDDDVFCKTCGLKIENRLSLEDSIFLAKELEKKYAERDRLKKEISNLEIESAKYRLPERRLRYSAFRYFWPFIIYSQLSCLVVGIVFVIILLNSRLIDMGEESLKTLITFFCFLAMGATIIFGAVYARIKRDRMNRKLEEEEQVRSNEQMKIEFKISELRGSLRNLEYNLKDYEKRVPEFMRYESGMKKVRQLLENGEAEDFDIAVCKCR